MTDTPPDFKSGDKVVPLAGLSTQCGAIAGAVSAGLVASQLSLPWMPIVAGSLLGGAAGFLIGRVVGRLLFPAEAGQALVVGAGKAALPLTLRAATVPAVLAGLSSSVVTAFVFGTPLWSGTVLCGVAMAVAVGLLFGLGSALA